MTNRTTYTYNKIIKSHLSSPNSNPQMAVEFFVKTRRKWIYWDNYTYPFVLKACKMISGLWEGRQVHGEVVKLGFFDSNVFVRNGLIGIYVECGHMVEAHKLFDEMPERDVVSSSVMIHGYAKKKGDITRARLLFDKMVKRDLVSWNTMIDSYAKVGDMAAARELFDEMEQRNLISWCIIINGYSQHQYPKEALNVFNQMLSRDIKPDKFCVVGAISSCAQLGALDQGRWIHMYIKKNNIKFDVVVNTSLMDMYMKCGSIKEARAVFNSMSERNVVSWNVMISGLGINGFGSEALYYFHQMEQEEMKMDDLIYVSVLSACSHGGFVTKGVEIFKKIQKPKLEHYGCLIDLFVRAGKLEQALNFIESMPLEPNLDLWGSVLLACRVRKNVVLGEFVLNRIKELGGDDCGVYVLMSNIYADNGMWEGVTKMRKLVLEKKVVKESGKSVIEMNGDVEEFVCGKKDWVRANDIQQVLSSILKMEDHDPSFNLIGS